MLTAPSFGLAPSSAPTLRVLTNFADVDAVVPAWRDLLDSSASAEPMLSPAWLLAWWRIYGGNNGRQPRLGLMYDGDRLIGLAPLQGWRVWHRRLVPMRRLEMLGADVPEGDGVCSEYLGILARKGFEERVAQGIANAVVQRAFGGWDELVFPAMDGSGPMPGLLLEAFAKHRLRGELTETATAPYLTLPATWDEYLKALPGRKRQFINKHLREFEHWAGGDFRFHSVVSESDIAQGQRILKELHQHRWEADGEPGAFASPRFTAFHDTFMRHLLSAGKLELMWLEARGRPIAAHYNFLANGKTYFYQSGRATDLPPKVSPGLVIMVRAIQNAIARGAREFDFLAGPSQFKLQFTQTTRPLVQLRVTRRCLAEALRCGVERAIDAAKRARNSWNQRSVLCVSI